MYLKVVWKVGWCAERFLVFKYACMQVCKYASMHIRKQVCKYAIIQVCKFRGGVTKKRENSQLGLPPPPPRIFQNILNFRNYWKIPTPPPRTEFRNVWNWEHIDGSWPPRIDIWKGVFALRRPYKVFFFFFYWFKKSYFH